MFSLSLLKGANSPGTVPGEFSMLFSVKAFFTSKPTIGRNCGTNRIARVARSSADNRPIKNPSQKFVLVRFGAIYIIYGLKKSSEKVPPMAAQQYLWPASRLRYPRCCHYPNFPYLPKKWSTVWRHLDKSIVNRPKYSCLGRHRKQSQRPRGEWSKDR